jgi:hypothetical protein
MSRYTYFQQLKEELKGTFSNKEDNEVSLPIRIKHGLQDLDNALNQLTKTEESV